MRIPNLSIKSKVVLATVTTAVLLIGSLTTLQLRLVREGLKDSAIAQQASVVSEAAADLDARLKQARDILASTAAAIPPDLVRTPGALREHLLARPELLVIYDDLLVADASGQVIADVPPLPRRTEINIGDRPFFRALLVDARPVLSDPVLSRHRQEPIVVAAAPIRDPQGGTLAVLTGVLRLQKPNLLGELATARQGRSGFFMLITKDGPSTYIVHPDRTRVLQPVGPDDVPHVAGALNGSEQPIEGRDRSGNDVLFSFKSLTAVNWLLVAALPAADGFAPIAAAERRTFTVAAVSALVAIPLLWFLMLRLLAPLSKLLAAVEAMRRQPHGIALPLREGNDEVGRLARAMRQLLAEREDARQREMDNQLRFEAAALSSMDAFFLLDAVRDAQGAIVDFRFRFVNGPGATLLKQPAAVLVGQRLREVLGLKPTSRIFRQYVATVESGVPFETEFEIAIPQIDARWVHQQIVRAGDGLAVTAADVGARKIAETELDRQREFLRTVLDSLPLGVTVRRMHGDDLGRIIVWNRLDEEVYGIPAADALGRTARELFPAESAARIEARDRALLENPCVQEITEAYADPRGGERVHRILRAPIVGRDGGIEYLVSATADVTAEQDAADQLRLASKVFETTADAIVVTDADDRVLMVNRAFSHLTGYAAEEMIGVPFTESPFRPLDPEAYSQRVARQLCDGVVTGEVQRRHKDGRLLDFWITATLVSAESGRVLHNIRVFTDISELKAVQKRLEELASRDALTGLPNRRLFQDRLTHAVARAERTGTPVALLFIDLDGFKDVNDRFGHDAGDELLRRIAARLSAAVRTGDSVCRLGGDEFTIVLEGADPTTDIPAIAQRLLQACALPSLRGEPLDVSGSIGIAVHPADAPDAATLIARADAAMYHAKRAGGNRCVRHGARPRHLQIASPVKTKVYEAGR